MMGAMCNHDWSGGSKAPVGARGALGAATSGAASASLEAAFKVFASSPDDGPAVLSKGKFVKLVTGLKGERDVLDGAIGKSDAAWSFDKALVGGKKGLAFADFEKALDKLAVYKGLIVEDIRAAISLASGAPYPRAPGGSAE